MKILKLNIERCGDCKNIECVKNSYNLPSGYWRCKILNERVALQTIPLLCPLEDDEPKTCATCAGYESCKPESFFKHDIEMIKTRFGCIYHQVKK